MERMRKPFQGVTNIIKFNWHFYVLAGTLVLFFLTVNTFLDHQYLFYLNILCVLVALPVLTSLFVSFYIYDLSNLYSFDWLDALNINTTGKNLNINSGFDETSILLSAKYPNAELDVFDFYEPARHTEISISRARNANPPYKGTMRISTSNLPTPQDWADNIFVIFSAHEIRNDAERINFFKELNRAAKQSGKIIVTEHLRDAANFFAYSIGFFHFLPRSTWNETFNSAGLRVCSEMKITPFITTFILKKNGTAS